MSFNSMSLISLIFAVIGIRVIRDLWAQRSATFDDTFTPADRQRVSQAAFFLLVPISVALHELGHAIAIWAYGGKVIDFGFYVFAGFVSYAEPFTAVQQTVVAAAGTIVNVILSLIAVAVVFLWKPSLRAPYNELLLQFAVISGANALLFYPLLDFATGINGDWTQMYRDSPRPMAIGIGIIHVGIIALAYAASKHASTRQRLATLTGMPAGTERGLFGDYGKRGESPVPQSVTTPMTTSDHAIADVAERVASGWSFPVQNRMDRRPDGTAISLSWVSSGAGRAVIVRAQPTGRTEVYGLVANDPTSQQIQPPVPRRLRTWADVPEADDLTVALRVAMEQVETWPSPRTAQYN